MGVVSPVVGLFIAVFVGATELPCLGTALVCCPIALGLLSFRLLVVGWVNLLTVLCILMEVQ